MASMDCKLGISIHVVALAEFALIEAQLEEDLIWVSEVLKGALATLKAPEVQLLPKTPSMKRARRTRKAANSHRSTGTSPSSATEDSSTTDGQNQSGSSRPQRTCRKKPRSTRATKKTKTEESINCIVDEMEKSIQETIPEETEKDELPAQSLQEEGQQTPQAKKAETTIATPDNNTPRNTPGRVAGYMSLNVKAKAKAFEQHCRNSHTPKRLQSPSVASHDEDDVEMTEPADETFTASPKAAKRRSSIRKSARLSGVRRSSVSQRRSSVMRHKQRRSNALVEHTKLLLLKKANAAVAAVTDPRVRNHLSPASPNKHCTRSKSRKAPATESYDSPRLRTKRGAQPSECTEEAKRPCKQTFTPNSGGTFSFLKRNTPLKSTQSELLELKRKELEAKDKKSENLLLKRSEMLHRQAESRRRRNEERQMLAAQRREEQICKIKQLTKEANQRYEDKKQLPQRLHTSKIKEEQEKARIRDQKLAEAEQKRRQEEEQRLQRLKENEREVAMLEELAARRKEHEEQERQKKLAEQRKAHEQQMAALQKEKEAARQRQLEDIRRKEEEIRRKEEEAKQKALRERQEMERLRQREMQRQEKEREDHEKEQKEREEAAARKAAEVKVKEGKSNSYDMTPTRKEYKKGTAENYNIDDLRSDDSTDEEDAPRKRIPDWAEGSKLKIYLINQTYKPPELDEIFGEIDSPDLNKLFNKRKARFNKRTSSAVWSSPMYKPSGRSVDDVEESTRV